MILTERDIDLLFILQDYGILTTRQLALKVFPGVAITTVLRRLRALEGAGYIRRIEGLPSMERAWLVTEKALRWTEGGPAKLHAARHSLEHDLKLTSLRIQLEAHGIVEGWASEHEIRSLMAQEHGLRESKRRVVPDGIAGVEINGAKECIAIELELNFKNSRRYRSIISDYRSKENLHLVWYLVGSAKIGRHLMKTFRQGYYSKRPPYFCWSILDDVMCAPWSATLNFQGEKLLASQVFKKLRSAPEPAHTPAQGVSGQGTLLNESTTDISTENETEMLSPAS